MVVNLFVKILASGPAQDVISGIQSYPVPEIILFRSLITFLICCAVIRVKKIPFFGVNKKWLLIRGVFGTTALTMFFFTLDNLPIAVATTVQYLSPIFTVLIATFLLSERVQKIQWVFMLVAFVGIAMLGISKFLSQDASVTNIDPLWVLLGVFSAVLSGIAYNAIVKCQNTDHPITVVMYFPLIATPVSYTHLTLPTKRIV